MDLWFLSQMCYRQLYTAQLLHGILNYTLYCIYRNFFEMVRFDFALDENGNVYLMEVGRYSRTSMAPTPLEP